MKKPHITIYSTLKSIRWCARGGGGIGFGSTPSIAYKHLISNLERDQK